MIGYRLQDENRNINDLLTPELWMSCPMDNDDDKVRHGVSGCASLAELAAYIACNAIEAAYPVIVKIEGDLSDDEPLDADQGEFLYLPTSAEVIEDDDEFFEIVGDLVDLHYTKNFGYRELLEVAEERI